jgi:hypothetical protein
MTRRFNCEYSRQVAALGTGLRPAKRTPMQGTSNAL